MITLQTRIIVGREELTIEDILRTMRCSASAEQASYWATFIYQASIELGMNEEISKNLGEILISKGYPATQFVDDTPPAPPSDMPQPLINRIFVTEIDGREVDCEKLWVWINDNLVSNLEHQYEWTALRLFLSEKKLLLDNGISHIDFADAMTEWFPKTKYKCTSDNLGTYGNGLFATSRFSYRNWIIAEQPVPTGYTMKKDQSERGFSRLQRLCGSYLEPMFDTHDILKTPKTP